MLNIFSRRAVSPARARFSGAAALACAWLLAAPAHAAGAEPPEPAAATLFKQYQRWRDEPLQDWRQSNERVGEIGGWRTYLREAQPAGNGVDQGQHGHHGQ
ncbi:MAG: hypothetical protein KKE84_06810 [Gammaproteobacteria bacterium]|nr:hypothetical protein [Gammaproteobacteria bacterium]